MKNFEYNLQNLKNSAFNYALYATANVEVANDISSEVISFFLLNFNEERNAEGWIINTTKNYCKKYFSIVKRNENIAHSYRKEILNTIQNNSHTEQNEELKLAFNDSFSTLTDNEFKMILYYFQCNESIKILHSNIGGSYSSLRVKISRIKRKLKAETFKRLGYIGTKKIVTPQLNDNIINFLKSFKENLEANTLDKMYYYFSEIDLSNYHQNIKIKKILEYDIEYMNPNYKAWIFFEATNGEINSFSIMFFVDKNNMLKILSPPSISPKTVIIESKSEQGKLLEDLINKYPPDKSGRPGIPPEEMEKLIKQLEKENKK